MSDTVSTLPDWLAKAVAEHEQQQHIERGNRVLASRRIAESINASLQGMGITPQMEAYVDDHGCLQGALLVEADYAEDAYEVRALWDGRSQQVELHTRDWDGDGNFGRVRLLNTIADVAAARHETPTPPQKPRDFRVEALRAIDTFSPDRLGNHEVEAVVTAANGITAAILHLADTIARTNSRP
ncbi:hypothetical protein [Streptomyces filamentosus]|uniref:hypothetical protein n=1 Tax=Streptomyces filamentosus TaxID=67294 RepID=UPI003400FF6F